MRVYDYLILFIVFLYFALAIRITKNQDYFRASAIPVESFGQAVDVIQERMSVSPLEKPYSIEFVYDKRKMSLSIENLAPIVEQGSGNMATLHEFSLIKTSFLHHEKAIIDFFYYDENDDEEYIEERLNEIAEKINREEMGDYEKVKAINKLLLGVTYSKEDERAGQSVRVLLENGKGACAAYAKTAQRLFEKVGLKSFYVRGKGKGRDGWTLHAWNKVEVEGLWYNFDATLRLSEGQILLSDNDIKETHFLENSDMPPCVNSR